MLSHDYDDDVDDVCDYYLCSADDNDCDDVVVNDD